VTAIVVLLRRPLAAPDGTPAPALLGRCDDAALRAAVALSTRVTVLAVGPAEREDASLRHAVGRGAERAVRVWDPGLDGVDYHATAQVLAAATRKLGFDLVLAGDRSDDEGDGAVGPAVAEALGVPHLTAAIDVGLDGDAARATRRDSGLERTLRVKLPAVVTVASSPAAPAAPSRAGRFATLDLGDLGIHASELRPRLHCQGTASQVAAPAPILAERPDELIARLARDHLLEP